MPEPAGPPRFWRPSIAVVAGLALAGRAAYAVSKRHQPLLGDAIYYSAQAKTLAEGKGFAHPFFGGPAADHPPLTSLVLAPVALVTSSITAQRLLMAVVGALVVVAVAYLAHLVAGPRAGLVAAVVAAAYPNLWMNDALTMSDALTALLVAALLIAVWRWRRSPTAWWAAAIGAAAGLGTLARAELPILVVLLVVPVMLLGRDVPGRTTARHVGVATGVALVLVGPWIGANLVRFDKPVLLSTNDGLTLVGANCESTYYGGGLGFWDLRCAPLVEGDPSDEDAAYRTMATDYIRDHLGRIPTVVAARIGRVWGFYRPSDMVYLNQGEGRERWASRLGIWAYDLLVPLGAFGVWALWERGVRGRDLWILLAPFVAVTITAAVFYGIARFRVPAEVPLVVLAAAGLDDGWARLTRWRASRAAAG